MKTRNQICKHMLVLLLLPAWVFPLNAQTQTGAIVITEVFLDQSHPNRSWVELFNPTSETLVCERFRLSHQWTPSILPREVRQRGGMVLSPGQCLVVCANKALFTQTYGEGIECLEVPHLAQFGRGGFIGASTKASVDSPAGIVRYGDPLSSSRAAAIGANEVVEFSNQAISYGRSVSKAGTGYSISSFKAGAASPGKPTN